MRFKSSANYCSVNTPQCEIGHRSQRSNEVQSFVVILKKLGRKGFMSEVLDTEGAIMVSHRPSICRKRLQELLCPFLSFVHLHSSGQHILLEKKNYKEAFQLFQEKNN